MRLPSTTPEPGGRGKETPLQMHDNEMNPTRGGLSEADSARADELVAAVLNAKRAAGVGNAPAPSAADGADAAEKGRARRASGKGQLNFRAEPEVRRAVRRLAFERDCSMSDILNEAVRAYIPGGFDDDQGEGAR
jgi:hypothetical protein